MVTTATGQAAERSVVEHLASQGFKILNKNWKTKVCEIDIIAEKDKIIYFVEVKFRGADAQGTGFDYIGPRKLNQLKFAARVWVQNKSWDGDYRIIGAEVSGQDFGTINITELV